MKNELTLRQIVDGISAPFAVMTPDGALEIVNRPRTGNGEGFTVADIRAARLGAQQLLSRRSRLWLADRRRSIQRRKELLDSSRELVDPRTRV